MPIWITVYCQASVETTPQKLLDGIEGRDPTALAGADYPTLAEDYGVDGASVDEALAALAIKGLPGDGDGYEVSYGASARPLFVRRWCYPARVAEEVQEVVDEDAGISPETVQWLRTCCEVIGIELGASQFRDMGIVIAYEIARYFAQKGDGVIRTDDGRWLRVEDGAFTILQ